MLKTYLIVIQLCISFFFCYAELNKVSELIVSDSAKVRPFFKLSTIEQVEKLKIPLIKSEEKKVFWVLPAIAWNNYDKTQVGLLLGINHLKHFKMNLAPMFGTGSKNFIGLMNAQLSFESEHLKSYSFELAAKRFSYLLFPEDLSYNVLNGKINIAPEHRFKGQLELLFSARLIWQEYLLRGRQTQFFYLNQLEIKHTIEQEDLAMKTRLSLQQGAYFGLAKLEGDFKLKYQKRPGNALHLRAFVGTFIYNKRRSNYILPTLPVFQLSGSTNSGIYWLQKDYAFDDLYLDRNARDPFFQKQVASSEGGFFSQSNVGNAQLSLFSLNVFTDIGFGKKVQKYFNIQGYTNLALSKNKLQRLEVYAEGGIKLQLIDKIINFYIPLATTKNIRNNQSSVYGIEKGDWTKRITFSIDFLRIKERFNQGKHRV